MFALFKSFGENFPTAATGYFTIISDVRIGRSTKFPAQLGYTFLKRPIAHDLQNVHSKEQIIAYVDVFGSMVLQCSQLGLISNMMRIFL
tara:strand:- start:1215 stop:1481 length:267 start_codon:yes stop_codon:yes gene_type:complete